LRISNDLNNFLLKIIKIQDFELISKGLEILEKAYIANQDVFHIIFLFFSVVLDLVEDILKDFELKKLENEESQEKFEKISVWVALMFAVQNKNMDQKTRIFNLKQKLKPIFNELQIGYSTVKHRDPEILIEDEENQDYHYSNIKLIDKKLLSYQDAPIFAISKKDFKVGIHLGQYNSQNKTHKIVIKSYQITNNMESVRSQIENEIKVYQILSKNRDETNSFLKYFGSIFEDNTIKMVMDFCENNLMDYIDHLKEIGFRFQETQFTMISYKLVNSFRIMADLGIFHQDIKPHNLLVDSHWNLKIIDFNVSLIKPQDFTIFGTGTYPIQGTLGYLSPELQQMIEERRGHQKFNPEKSDVYSLGLVLFQMLTYEKVQGLSSNKLRKMVEKLDFISGYSKTFLKKMLEQDPSQRPKFAEVLSMIPFDPKTLTGAAGLPFK
jgi:serine/threonine protein kinase